MSLRRTVYGVSEPPKELKNTKWLFSRRKSAITFLYVKTVSGKVIRHSLACLTVHKWLLGDVPLNVNLVHKVKHPLARQRYHRFGNPTHALFILQ